jgi:hypothetical protein
MQGFLRQLALRNFVPSIIGLLQWAQLLQKRAPDHYEDVIIDETTTIKANVVWKGTGSTARLGECKINITTQLSPGELVNAGIFKAVGPERPRGLRPPTLQEQINELIAHYHSTLLDLH